MTSVPGTTPYAWPFDGDVDSQSTALVVVGAGPAWATFVPEEALIADRIARLRADLTAAGALVVLVEHQIDTSRLIAVGSPATPIEPNDTEMVITAAGIDGFYGSALDALLRRHGRDHLLVCGFGLESTVHSTVRRANDRGYECLTIIDASVPHDPNLVAASRSSVEMSGGIFGAIGTTDDVLTAYPPTHTT